MKKPVIIKYNNILNKTSEEERQSIATHIKELFEGTDSKPIIVFCNNPEDLEIYGLEADNNRVYVTETDITNDKNNIIKSDNKLF